MRPASKSILRPYQQRVLERVDAEFAAGRRRQLLQLPTGSGKTVVAAEIIRKANARVLFLAHRRELITQASRRLHAVGIDHGVILPWHAPRPAESVQIASIASLHVRAIRGSSMELPAADIVIVDEAHHCRAKTYRKILAAYPDATVIGLTATPCRADGRGLGSDFQVLIDGPSVAELVADGWLVPTQIYAPSRPDLSGVGVQHGEYVERQLAERMDTAPLVGDIVQHWFKLAERRKTVVFATGVAHSIHLRDEFRRAGVLAEHIDGGTPTEQRDAILGRLATGDVELVCNAAVLTEGWDSPEVSCLVLARPTKSMGLYRQMVGRILRPAPGKSDALILDHAGAVFAHGFPDDPIRWTLSPDRKAENVAHARRGGAHAPGLTTCPECKAVRLEGRECTVCGWRPQRKPIAVEVIDGELGRLHRDRTVSGPDRGLEVQQRFYGMLLHVARQRGFKPGWAAYKHREKFGSWPDRDWVESTPPDDATLAWIRSRQIAYAKAMEKGRAAS